MDNIMEEENILLNSMTEAEQFEYYINQYNEMKKYNRRIILQLMMTTQCEMRDDIVNTLNEFILEIDKSIDDIDKYKLDL